MTIIAYDGKSIAADKQATCAGLRSTTTKLRRLETGTVLAWCGEQDGGELMARWFAEGCKPGEWPEIQKDNDRWSRLIVWNAGSLFVYERQPVPIRIEDPFMAWGSGRDYALAAMACGKTAREAVEIACRFDNGCGMGIDEMRFE